MWGKEYRNIDPDPDLGGQLTMYPLDPDPEH
jgi:hypothetical protein